MSRRSGFVLWMEAHLRGGGPEREGVRIHRRERLRRVSAGMGVRVGIAADADGEVAKPKQSGADGVMGGVVENGAGAAFLLRNRARRPVVKPLTRSAHPPPPRHQGFDVVGRARRIPKLDGRRGGRVRGSQLRRLRPRSFPMPIAPKTI